MRAILSILMIVSLVLQAMFGCCRLGGLHCAHDEDDAVCEADWSAGCVGNHHVHMTAKSPECPCGCATQCRGVCNYLPSAQVRIEPLTTENHFVLAVVIPTGEASGAKEAFSTAQWEHSGGESLAPLRLHLLNQVWLI